MALTEAGGSSLGLDDALLSTADGEGAAKVFTAASGPHAGLSVEAALAALVTSHFLSTITIKANNYTVVAGDKNTFLDVTGTSLISLLPEATAGAGFALLIKNSGAGVVTVEDDAASLLITLAVGGWAILTCDGTVWKFVQYTVPVGASDISNLVSKPIDRLLQYYGDESDGAYATSGADTLSDFLYDHTTFLLNAGHAITIDTPVCIIRATTSIVIDGDINATGALIAAGAGAALGRLGDSLGSSGGGGGGGGAGYHSANAAIWIPGELGDPGESTYFQPGGAGGISGGVGSVGSVVAANQKVLIAQLFSSLITRGGGAGGNGGSGGPGFTSPDIDLPVAAGVGGLAGCLLILIAPTITINAASTIDLSGQAGTNAANVPGGNEAGGSGGGGGGAGGSMVKVSPAIADGGTTTVTGGAAGSGDVVGFAVDGGDGAAGAAGYTYEIDPT